MWQFEGKDFSDELIGDNIGFVYLITNLITGKRYFGKKLFFFSKTAIRTVKLKNGTKKKKKIKSLIDSDWRDYWSSSEELKKDVILHGEDKFCREILHLCKTKGMMGYLEAKLQFKFEVLEKPNEFYNGIINCKIHRTHIKLD